MSQTEIRTSSDFFRAVNERILALTTSDGVVDLICECPAESCTEVMRMTRDEHAATRAEPSVYALLPHHERPGLGEIVARLDRYVLVRTSVAPAAASRAPGVRASTPAFRGRIELVCRACGYGIVVATPPTGCPMCNASSWRTRSARPELEAESWALP